MNKTLDKILGIGFVLLISIMVVGWWGFVIWVIIKLLQFIGAI